MIRPTINYGIVLRIHGWILAIEAAFMVPAMLIAFFTGDAPVLKAFLVTIGIALICSSFMWFMSRNAERKFYAREGMLCTGTAWIVLSIVGALPFYLSGRIPSFVDSFFEIVSGFTTTGASILSDVEAIGKALLYWRSFSHWVGGMGVLVFFLAIIPASGRNEGYMLHLLRAESPGPAVSKMVPRMKDTAVILYSIYCALTVLDVIFLLIGRMPVFDAFCIAFGTAGTGGFAVLNTGLSTYTPFAQYVTTVFMLLFGVNFSIYYVIILKRFRNAFGDEELNLYLGIVLAAIIFIAFNIFKMTPQTQEIEPTIRHSAFQVASIITTTGYSTVDFDMWPVFSKAILMCLMFCGASAGSTGGGIKVARVLLLAKGIRRNAKQIFHPNEVRIICMNHQRVPEQTMANVNGYLSAYVAIVIVSFLILCFDRANYSMTTNFSSVMATFNNIGPGFEAVGPACNFSGYSAFSKMIMSLDMLLGRLEIFPIIAIFAPSTYLRG
ncbi:MAG: TrkH family potassium uptake protein [Lachnospiraceae bacterium]|nr:TrkH family potassium uptake protein [Lachnospiraceae bacterium]